MRSLKEYVFAKDSIGILCNDLLKFFEGLKPTVLEGEISETKSGCFFSINKISFFNLSYSASSTNGSLNS